MEAVVLHFLDSEGTGESGYLDFHRPLGVGRIVMALKGSAGCGRLSLGRYDNGVSILSILTPNNSKSSSVGGIVT